MTGTCCSADFDQVASETRPGFFRLSHFLRKTGIQLGSSRGQAFSGKCSDWARREQLLGIALVILLVAATIVALFAAYNLFHYVLFLLVTHPKDAGKIGHQLNEFEQRQLVEWRPRPDDFLKHDDENRTYDDVFGAYRDEQPT